MISTDLPPISPMISPDLAQGDTFKQKSLKAMMQRSSATTTENRHNNKEPANLEDMFKPAGEGGKGFAGRSKRAS